jgi:hypothetical protein
VGDVESEKKKHIPKHYALTFLWLPVKAIKCCLIWQKLVHACCFSLGWSDLWSSEYLRIYLQYFNALRLRQKFIRQPDFWTHLEILIVS